MSEQKHGWPCRFRGVNELIFKREAHMGAKRLMVIVAIGLLVLATATNAISKGKEKEDEEEKDKHDRPCQLVFTINVDGTIASVTPSESCERFEQFPPGSRVDLGAFTGRQEGCAILPTTGSPECVSLLHEGNLYLACE